ncbi:MAG: universal stress protein [Bacillota bacterium]
MFAKVLLAADGSEPSLRAAAMLPQLKELNPDLQVTVLTVYPQLPNAGLSPLLNYGQLVEAAEEYMAEIAARYRELLAGWGLTAETRQVFGDPGEVIAREAERGGYDLILMGTRGLTNLEGLVLGSVAHKVLHLARVPVMLVK